MDGPVLAPLCANWLNATPVLVQEENGFVYVTWTNALVATGFVTVNATFQVRFELATGNVAVHYANAYGSYIPGFGVIDLLTGCTLGTSAHRASPSTSGRTRPRRGSSLAHRRWR